MAASEVVLKILNNQEEPLEKRLRIADNALGYTELQFHHKESLLLKWLLNNSPKEISHEKLAEVLKKWISSKEFLDLTQNDISNQDIRDIIQLLLGRLLAENVPTFNKLGVVDSVLLLCDIKVFQNYFSYNIDVYCELLSVCLGTIREPGKFVETLRRHLFPKELLVQDGFVKQFFNIICPVLVNKIIEFQGNDEVFKGATHVVQKCIFQGHTKEFQSFFNEALGIQSAEKHTSTLPKQLFKYLNAQNDPLVTSTASRLLFSAFIGTFKDTHWGFYYLVFLCNMLKLNQYPDFTILSPIKQKKGVTLSKLLQLISGVLDQIASRNFVECTLGNTSFTEYLRNILKFIISTNVLNVTVFKIILACIQINPLSIEPIATTLFVHLVSRYSEEYQHLYEDTIKAIFEVFGKLHRLENFVAKIIPAIKNLKIDVESSGTYTFGGEQDLEISTMKLSPISKILSRPILDFFAKCLNNLASWQTINMFKTLLFHLREVVTGFSKDTSQDADEIFNLEFIQKLITVLLMHVKVADNSTPQNVTSKFTKGLLEFKGILNELGAAVLRREHNHVTMRAFLELAYIWAEINITLNYYSDSKELEVSTVNNSPSAANLTYLHSYMDVNDWKLVTQRISNFGEAPCKICLQKLYFQKLRSMLLFEKDINEDIISNIIKSLQANLEHTWQDLLLDRFALTFVLPKLDKVSLTFLAEKLIENDTELKSILNSTTLIDATVYTLLGKINKLFRIKRKHDAAEKTKCFSSKIFSLCPDEIFFSQESFDISGVIVNMQNLYEIEEKPVDTNIQSKEDQLRHYLLILKRCPVIYSDVNVQKVVLLYLIALCTDTATCSNEIRQELENIIIGMLQGCKFPISDIFKMDTLGSQVLTSFNRHDTIISLIIDNAFKRNSSIMEFEPFVEYLTNNMEDAKCMSCCMLVLQAVAKVKKSKMDPSSKEQSNSYKDKILAKMLKLVCKSNQLLVEAYATCLRHFLATPEKESDDNLKKLLNKLDVYLDHCFNNVSDENRAGCTSLFTVVLQNKSQIKHIDTDIVLKVWNCCKRIGMTEEENAFLVKLVVTFIPNEQFEQLFTDLFDLTNQNIISQNHSLLSKQLKTWESILSCDVNAIKMKIWQDVLEKLMYQLLGTLKTTKYQQGLFKNAINLEQSIIQAQRFLISPPLIDMFIRTPSILMRHEQENFEEVFAQSITILESLLKHRNAIVMDRLPAFLQQYRVLLKSLTIKSNSDHPGSLDFNKATDCAHHLEKLTKNLVGCKKDMGRIAVFLIADILERYEQINLYPNVKLHLNNCVYSLMSLCDHHAVSYLMRVLSDASTEMFKIMYSHYKKFYMFSGRV
ncbi:uncharacterized protein LOC126737851 [Anthonomus grandis grandis]|uniref:uncharacterized protein LOC126737851 n=1 Tax=Anthonomus grandis grandis TaxID=2921223 RepID=UPI0021665DE4|nr:uncharacterized protein LOC126737851 [Anthonomus grandis grandis]